MQVRSQTFVAVAAIRIFDAIPQFGDFRNKHNNLNLRVTCDPLKQIWEVCAPQIIQEAAFHIQITRQILFLYIHKGNLKCKPLFKKCTFGNGWVQRITLYRIHFRSDVKKHLSVPCRNAIFRGIIATEKCCFPPSACESCAFRIGQVLSRAAATEQRHTEM